MARTKKSAIAKKMEMIIQRRLVPPPTPTLTSTSSITTDLSPSSSEFLGVISTIPDVTLVNVRSSSSESIDMVSTLSTIPDVGLVNTKVKAEDLFASEEEKCIELRQKLVNATKAMYYRVLSRRTRKDFRALYKESFSLIENPEQLSRVIMNLPASCDVPDFKELSVKEINLMCNKLNELITKTSVSVKKAKSRKRTFALISRKMDDGRRL